MSVPEIIKNVGFDFSWDEEKVWKLRVPSTEIPIKDLEWHLSLPFLSEAGKYDLTPYEVIDKPHYHQREYFRVQSVDLSYPIDVMENKGKLLILDGLHRLMKSYLKGLQTVKVRKIFRSQIPKIIKQTIT